MLKGDSMNSLERILTILDGEKPDRLASLCLGADYDFIHKFMNSPFTFTEEDLLQFEIDNLSYKVPNIQYLIAKFSPTNILPA